MRLRAPAASSAAQGVVWELFCSPLICGQSAGECREFLRQWEKERKGSTASRKNAKDRVPSMNVERRMSLDNLLNATLLLTPSTLIFLFKRALSGSNLVFLVGTTDHQKGGKECKRDGR
jgi:hypothetical protein